MMTIVFKKELLQDSLDSIGVHLHSMSVYASSKNADNFLKTFELLKDCFRKQFKKEEDSVLNESSKINYYHKIIHKIFLMDLTRYEKSAHESDHARMQVLVKIQNWYLNHMKDFAGDSYKGGLTNDSENEF